MLLVGVAAVVASTGPAVPAYGDPLLPPLRVPLPPIEIPPVVTVSPDDGVEVEVPPLLPGMDSPVISVPPPTVPGLIESPAPPAAEEGPELPPPVVATPPAPAPEAPPAPTIPSARARPSSSAANDATDATELAPDPTPPELRTREPFAAAPDDTAPAAVAGRIDRAPAQPWTALGTAAGNVGLWIALVLVALIARFTVASMWRDRRVATR